ncbi:MAG: efflux RND transporter permease subunit, partial [Candidatus Omnitrophica bacterium]|nr:efflux RND transporter permease subunit [Candidatus Omnitrophota bacterium]
DTIIPAIALPMSMIATFGVMLLLNFSLDNLSLMAMTLSVGFVVDDAIVVLENTVRLIEGGKKPFQAAIQSAKEITFTIISMTLSLAVIFIPLIFMGGVVGRIFREFSLTVIIAILCSGVVSLTLTPMMCARMLKGQDKTTRLQRFVNKYLGMVIKKYGETLEWTLKRPVSTIIAWVVCFAGTVALFNVLPQTFIPEGDSGAVYGQMVVPLGTSTTKVQKFQNKINTVLQKDPAVDKLISLTGLAPGADQSTGPFFAILKERKNRKSIQDVVKGLRFKMSKLTEGFAYLQAIPALKLSAGGESTAAGSKYSYQVTGDDQDELYKSAQELEKKMKALPGFVDVQNSVKLDMPKLELDILRDRASTLGITAQDIEYALALAYAGGKLTTYKTDVDQYYIIVELEKEYQKRPESLSTIYIHSPVTNGLVPLASVVKVRKTVGPQDVPHYNHMNSATISFNIQTGVALGNATKALEKAAKETLPPGVTGSLQGEAQEFEESVASLGILIIIAIIIKYIILGILYESYVHPLTILTTLPVATFGGLLTLLLFGSELSLYAYVGVFMLLGIVAKNGIMMVDFAQQNLEKGASDFDAIHQASIVRFRPILMTGLAAIMGAVPIALGYGADGESRRPLGLIVVGGLIFSQVVTLYVTPGLFLYMQKFQRRYLDKYELTRSGRKEEE